MNLPKHNTGLIEDLSPSIWVGGQIPFKVVNDTSDWREYAPELEKQKDPVETMACVTFSLLNNLETQHNFKGIKVNLADRFTAKVSDTQQNGNTFERVADSCRLSSSKSIGVVPEPVWPNSPKAQTWAEYYKTIPIETIKQAIKVDFNYEIVPRTTDWANTLRYNLKQCPLWITWPASPYHAMTLVYVHPDNVYADALDHYSRQIQKIKVSDIAIAARVVINKYLMDNVVIYKDGSEYQLAHKAISEQGFAQQLFDAGLGHLVTEEGKPNFTEIDKIAHIL